MGRLAAAHEGERPVSKTAVNRDNAERKIRRRLRYDVWAWSANMPRFRSRAARHATPCSCYWCRAGYIERAKHKRSMAPSASDWEQHGD